jgi:hypothetical protein
MPYAPDKAAVSVNAEMQILSPILDLSHQMCYNYKKFRIIVHRCAVLID